MATGPAGTLNALDLLRRGVAIPACPLALTADRRLDERRQRALVRYYAASGVGGLAVAVHTTQFAIRAPGIDLLEPVLALAAEELDRADDRRSDPLVRVAGVCGPTAQAVKEAELARGLGYHAGLVSLAGVGIDEDVLVRHCAAVAEYIPIVGFYLQRAVGGPPLSIGFWRRLAELERLVAVKIAPFDRYRTIDVVRAVAESGRTDVALYTGNDDNIVADLVTPFSFTSDVAGCDARIVGGLLGHWSVWTRPAALLFEECRSVARGGSGVPESLLRTAGQVTDCNAAFFDAANGFAGCIAGLHEVLRRQGLLAGTWCLDPHEGLSPGQAEEIDRVCRAYPQFNDDSFVAEHRDFWLSG